MGKCKNCCVEILDETEYCPLCNSVLEHSGEFENMYPDARIAMKKMIIISRIYLFCGIIVSLVLVLINYLTSSSIWWSAVCALGILFGYLVLRYAIIGKSGYRTKTLVLATIAVLSIIAIDFITGYRGWSVNIGLPAGILVVDILILGSMIFNHRNWQSYIMLQLVTILLSLIPVLLNIIQLERNRYMAFLPLAVSAAIFLGTMIIGGRKAKTELRRRFHIN